MRRQKRATSMRARHLEVQSTMAKLGMRVPVGTTGASQRSLTMDDPIAWCDTMACCSPFSTCEGAQATSSALAEHFQEAAISSMPSNDISQAMPRLSGGGLFCTLVAHQISTDSSWKSFRPSLPEGPSGGAVLLQE